MNILLRIELIILSILISVFIFRGIKKSKLEVQHTILWICIAVTLAFSAIFPDFVMKISKLAGFETASNFVMFIGILLLFIINFNQTLQISKLSQYSRNLIQELSLLKHYQIGGHNFDKKD